MSEEREDDKARERLSHPMLDEIQFNGISIRETWQVTTDTEEFLHRYAGPRRRDDGETKYTILDRMGTRSFYLFLSDRCLFTRELVVGLQVEVLAKRPQWEIALTGETRGGQNAIWVSANAITIGSQNVEDIALLMQEFGDQAMAEDERRYGPLRRQKQYVELQLRRGVTLTEDQPFQVVAICEHGPVPHEHLCVWTICDSNDDEISISVLGEEATHAAASYEVSATGRRIYALAEQGDGMGESEPTYWVCQWLIPRHFQGPQLLAMRDSDLRNWTIPFDQSFVLTDADVRQALWAAGRGDG